MADRHYELIIETLKAHGAVLERQRVHSIWRFPNGKTWTVAQTPSCPFSYRNNLTDLRNFLGLNSPDRGKPGERREKATRTPPPAAKPVALTAEPTASLQAKLRRVKLGLPKVPRPKTEPREPVDVRALLEKFGRK